MLWSTPALHHPPCTFPNREEVMLSHMMSYARKVQIDGSFGDSLAAWRESERGGRSDGAQ